jgi:hypothetical protein
MPAWAARSSSALFHARQERPFSDDKLQGALKRLARIGDRGGAWRRSGVAR